jgi:hypothetical protein
MQESSERNFFTTHSLEPKAVGYNFIIGRSMSILSRYRVKLEGMARRSMNKTLIAYGPPKFQPRVIAYTIVLARLLQRNTSYAYTYRSLVAV